MQFIRPVAVKVIKVLTELHTCDGWLWLRGYQVDDRGNVVASRLPGGGRPVRVDICPTRGPLAVERLTIAAR
ncbi:hypothetical protein ACQP1S_26705 [Micromonospora matsumotoense]|uniref:hypothetical protein n=1 Tax=Micromonospora matsumotoense TaxID=121616 RepID=UPI003D8C7C93